jgi:hypothetical protein
MLERATLYQISESGHVTACQGMSKSFGQKQKVVGAGRRERSKSCDSAEATNIDLNLGVLEAERGTWKRSLVEGCRAGTQW